MDKEPLKILFYEKGVKDVETWVRDNKQMALFFGIGTMGVGAFVTLLALNVPSWRTWYMLLILVFIIGVATLASIHNMIIGLKVALPVLTEDGFIIPQRSRIGKGSEKPEERMEYFVPYSDIYSAYHRKSYHRKGTDFVWMKFKHPSGKNQVMLYRGKLLHDLEGFLEILESKGVNVISEV